MMGKLASVVLPPIKKWKPPLKTVENLNTISLFSGGGGLDLGFAAAGFNISCSTDIDPFSCTTLEINSKKKNFYEHLKTINNDIERVSPESLLSEGLQASNVDVLIGGPPCQAFSVFGRRKGLDDPRGKLVWEYLKVIQTLKPRVFVFENVSGLKSIHGGELYKKILKDLSLGGLYKVSAHSYQVSAYGIPQHRDRVFFIGSIDGMEIPPMMPTHGENSLILKPYRTVKEALRGLPEPSDTCKVPNHKGRKHSQRIVNRYRDLAFGERDPKTRINKLNPEKPSFTIIVGSDNGGGKGHVHPYVPREVTPRESARMQTFPDWWEFHGTGRHVIRQVGNAVPPLFAGILAEHLKKHIFPEQTQRGYEELIEILGLDYLKQAPDS